MTTPIEQPPLSDPFTTAGPDKTGCLPKPLPIQTTTSSSNYAQGQETASATSSGSPTSPGGHVKMPDGRRNSQGEILSSPAEDWKPNFKRVQSWSREEYKRVVYSNEMVEEPGQGTGFTEGGEGSRQV
ncbi:hypothetical protein IFR04_006615 [Cadophora malorum]|uniref:Uncharacterized protein n=1 Tax=Cadophora malorum TaxID=108018 RepID=A0A8H7W9A4_9HELO|nr:hypothetical protein IFR04_006615 [Cadophora malorum]